MEPVFPHLGRFSACLSLPAGAGRNLHSNYTLKLAKCKERYAFFSRIVQNIDFIFRIFHKKYSAFSTKSAGFLESAPADRRKREFFVENVSQSTEMVFHNVENGAVLMRHVFSTKLWEKLSTLGNADAACRVVD